MGLAQTVRWELLTLGLARSVEEPVGQIWRRGGWHELALAQHGCETRPSHGHEEVGSG